jgi:outer membrane protein assembly factor BamB
MALSCVLLVGCGGTSPRDDDAGVDAMGSGGMGPTGGDAGRRDARDGSIIIVVADGSMKPDASLPDFDFTTPPDQAVAYQINPAHSGTQTGRALRPPLRKRWSHAFEGAISYPLIANNRIFVVSQTSGNLDPTVYAFSNQTGDLLWKAGPYGGDVRAQPINIAFDRRRVFVTTDNGQIFALDEATGAELWSHHLADFYGFTTLPIATGGAVFVAGPHSVIALDERTGLPFFQAKDAVAATPTLGDGRLYMTTGCHETQALDPKSGSELWHFRTDCVGGGDTPNAFWGGRLFVQDLAFGAHFILDAATGMKITELPNTFYGPCFDGQRAFFAHVGNIVAYDVGTWQPVWNQKIPSGMHGPAIAAGGFLVVSDDQGVLFLLDEGTGMTVWSEAIAQTDPSWTQPAPAPTHGMGAGEGVVVVPFQTGLYVYENAGD